MASPGAHPELSVLISRADRPGLLALVRESLSRFTERDALQVLRSPHLSPDVVEEIALSPKLITARAVRKAIAIHPASPRSTALDGLERLLWRDLVDVGRSTRTPIPVRRAANQRILERLPFLALGEKTALARLADRSLLAALLEARDERVFAALLQNPRLDSEDLVRWISVGDPDAARLARLADDPRWNRHPQIRAALLACKETPRGAALSLIAHGTRAEWRRLMENPGTDKLLAACARRLYESDEPVDRRARHL
ncbi:MAG TPA: hypothetical protein VKF32_05045 [Thermoanaerobaculia bacterium]|nr:hypothetical protein [Thermoanaerobaculia bacterium]